MYWPHANKSPDTLDFLITSILNGLNKNITNLDNQSSDHSPKWLNLGATIANTSHPAPSNGNYFKKNKTSHNP